ncbi:MAG: Glycogen synthase [Candidatus Omnitrophica bacterium]|nr:Glycogen synthase [Candidatus Omnitrophota bacterium]
MTPARSSAKKLRVLCVASEVAPFAKTGGLADVTGSLPAALGQLGVETLTVLPRYRGLESVPRKTAPGVTVRFIEHEGYYNRHGLYGNDRGDYADNLSRYSYLCHEALLLCRSLDWRPDIVHVHDWQTALVPVLLKTKYAGEPCFARTRTLLTVHNGAYQGIFSARQYPETGLDVDLMGVDGFEFYGKINLLKGGLIFADSINTVSPGYARELLTEEYGTGLDGVYRAKRERLWGVLNGIDTRDWDPSRDKALARRYSAEDPSGKAACKAELQDLLGLPPEPETPLLAVVSRLAEQKGLDLLADAADRLLGGPVQLVVLGDGDAAYRRTFENIAKRHPRNTAVRIGFDGALARKIYAGCDYFLMPSLFEPCGLGQMIALRYGALPIVRRTGGLADTIVDLDADPKKGNGYAFDGRTAESLLAAVGRALKGYMDRRALKRLVVRAMKQDFSWERSAREYLAHYKEMLKK